MRFNKKHGNIRRWKRVIYLTPLTHGQINFIKFIESNKFDNAYNKNTFLFD